MQCTITAIKEGGIIEAFDGVYQKISTPLSEAFPVNPKDLDGVPDNTQLMYLHDAALLHNIRVRFSRDQIYTYTAHLLVAVNPYKSLPIYTQEIVDQVR